MYKQHVQSMKMGCEGGGEDLPWPYEENPDYNYSIGYHISRIFVVFLFNVVR